MAQSMRGGLSRTLKADGSIVTLADQEIERWLRPELESLVPGSATWGEEQGRSEGGSAGLWLVDPIDGTSNYAFGSPLWGVSIALYQEGGIQLGVVAIPDLAETYSARAGGGTTCNGEPIDPVPPGPVRPEELVSYCDSVRDEFARYGLPGKMRYAGAFVVEAAFFLKQRFRGVIAYRGSAYDFGACLCLAEEAGADVRYADGSAFAIDDLMHADRPKKPFLLFPKNSGFYLRTG